MWPAVGSLPVTLLGVLGLLVGSFLNVVIWRLPRGESLSHPGSACPHCGHPIRWWDNIPVLSWLALRGRCRDCGEPISWRYPAVELATGILFCLVGWWALAGELSIASPPGGTVALVLTLVAFLYLAAISIALSMIDLDTHKLPNKIVLPGYVVGVALLGAASILSAEYDALVRGGIGLAAMFAAYLLMTLAYPGGMGFGDVKLAGVLGFYLAWLGWGELLVGAFGAFILGGVFSIALLALRKANRKSGIPFGPWMLMGAWLGVLWGDTIWASYLAMFGVG